MDEVRDFFRGMNDSPILQYGLGIDKFGAPELAKCTIVVVMDCEPRCSTEYGLQTFTRNIYYYLIRLLKTAHYVNRKWCPGNPENIHFRVTRFVTNQQAKDFLTGCIFWPIDEKNPDIDKCPISFLGPAVRNDIEMLSELGVDPTVIGYVVAVIDTQTIANEQGVRGRGYIIGLEALMSRYRVSYRDSHTAGNDAAYTIIAALQMVMNGRLSVSSQYSRQDVVDGLEIFSHATVLEVGVARYCTHCAGFDYNRFVCSGRIKRCKKCLKAGYEAAAYTHVTKLCTYGIKNR